MSYGKKLLAGSIAIATLAGAGVVGATVQSVYTSGSSGRRALVACPGGMSRLGHDFNEQMSIFPFDPAIHIENLYTVAVDFFKVEDIDTGAHAGTHIDVPEHFIEGGRSLDEFAAEEFVWPAYKIDMRGMTLSGEFGDQLTVDDIRGYEADNGRIRRGSLVVLQTGIEEKFGLDDPGDERIVDADGLSQNIDDLFADDTVTLGIDPDAVNWLFANRNIDGIGTDAYGPDASSDGDFVATYNTLANDGIALVAMANLDSVSVRSDVIMAPAVNLTDGSGFSVDPLACHGRPSRWGW
jgi:kynurenine formamidase